MGLSTRETFKLLQNVSWSANFANHRIDEYLVYWAIPSLHWMLPPCQVKLWHSLSILPFICRVWKLFCVCGLCTETGERAGLAVGVWLNNSGYWQSGAGLLTSHITADDPQHWAQYQSQSWRFSLISAWIHIAPFSGTKLLNLALTGTYSKWKSSHTKGAVHKWGRVKTLQRTC